MYTRSCLLLAVLLSIEYSHAQQGHHTEVKVNHMKIQSPKVRHQPSASQEPEALVPGPPPVPALTVSIKNFPKPPEMTADEKEISALNLTKQEKEKLFPCEDYSFICRVYSNIKDQHCRQDFMQKNCRKTCELCDVPYGVSIGCADLKVCKTFAKSACVLRCVRETCKSKCGQCGGYERNASSSIFMGNKRHMVGTKLTHSTKGKQDKEKSKKGLKTKSIEEKYMTKVENVKVTLPKNNKQHDKKKTAKAILQPKETAVEKAVPKNEESLADDTSEGSGDQDKKIKENTEERSRDENNNDNDEDGGVDKDDEEVDSDDKNEDMEKIGEGSSKDKDDNEQGSKEKPGEIVNTTRHSADKPAEPVRMDMEPVVAKLVTQAGKFHKEPYKTTTVKIARHEQYRTVPNKKRVQ